MKFYKKTVIGRGSDNTPYLVRYSLFSCRSFAVKVHHILISDDDCLHDHPWAFITLLLSGGYGEQSEKGYRYFKRFSLLFRKAQYKHALVIFKPVWTLVITFKRRREWGFWNSMGFTPWYKYNPTGKKCD